MRRDIESHQLATEPAGTAQDLIAVRLTAVRYAARDTNLYEFERPDGGPMPTAGPGAHIDLHLPNGLMRQYSLVVAEAHPTRYVVGIKRDPQSRGGSRFIHDELRPGALIKIGAPRNNFPLDENAGHTVLIAGGIGITPVWCMLQRLRALGRSWELHYSCRSRADAAFLRELESLENVGLHFDEEHPGQFMDMTAIAAAAPAGAHAYCCGPAQMLAAFEKATASWERERVHVEYFSSKHELAVEGGFIVELAKSGKELSVPPGKTILQVVDEAGVKVPHSCQQGVCGACETRVLSGVPDHRDSILTDSEKQANNTMMICCSGSKGGRLVLDL